MLVRLFVTVFGHDTATLFGRIGFKDDDGRFISSESKRITGPHPIDAISGVVRAYKDGFYPPMVDIDGQQFAIDLTEIQTNFV